MRPVVSRRALLAAAPAGLSASAASVTAQTPVLRVGSVPTDPGGEAYYAATMGFFSEAGLDVNLTSFTNGAGSTTAVAGCAIDIGNSTVTMMANATIHGVPLVFIAPGAIYDGTPTAVLATAAGGPIATPRDFEGKTCAVVGIRDGTHLALAAYLTTHGVDLARVDVIEMPFPAMLAALSRGRVAGAILVEPFITAGGDAIRVFADPLQAIAPRFLTVGWFASRGWVERNRALAKRFAAVIDATARWANANHERSAEILAQHAKVGLATIRRMRRTTYAETLTPDLIDPSLRWAWRLRFTDRLVHGREMIAHL